MTFFRDEIFKTGRTLFSCMAALLFPAVAPAATMIASADDPSVSAALYRAEAEKFPMVGTVTGPGLYSGSGVYIGNGWVLTAGHVALSKSGGSFTAWGQSYTIQSSLVHPDFTLSGPTADIGLLYIGDPAGAGAAATMFEFTDPASILGREATWVGHGLGGTGITGWQGPFDFRAFTNVIDAFGPDWEGLPATSFVADFDRPDGSTNAPGSDPTATRLEGNVAAGDSGGGVFIVIGGKYYLVGISSYSGTLDSMPGATNGRYGAVSGATRLDLYYDWIFQHTGISPVPEPSTILLAACGLFLWRRRRD